MKELIEKLYNSQNKIDYELVKEIKDNKGKINQYLLEELDKNIQKLNKKQKPCKVIDYLLFFLADLEEKETFPLIINFLSIPKLKINHVLKDITIENLSSIIVSVFNGDFDKLNSIIENNKIASNIRTKVIETYIYFYNHNLINKNDLITYLRKVISLYNYDDDIYNSILTVVINTHLKEMIPDVQEIFDSFTINHEIQGRYEDFIDSLFKDSTFNMSVITTTDDDTSWWSCLNKKDSSKTPSKTSPINSRIDLAKSITKLVENYISSYNSDKEKNNSKDKKPKTLSYQQYIDESLQNYPKKNSNKELDFYSYYTEEQIEIDKLLYKALKIINIPIDIRRDIKAENEINYNYLDKAYHLIKDIIKKYNFKTIIDYDNNISIHFSLPAFFDKYTNIMAQKINAGNKEYLENLKEIITYFYKTFKIDPQEEGVFLDKINYYYLTTERYSEARTFFESKLNDKYDKVEIYDILFNIYYHCYSFDYFVDKMDDIIDAEKDKSVKQELKEMKNEYLASKELSNILKEFSKNKTD